MQAQITQVASKAASAEEVQTQLDNAQSQFEAEISRMR